MKKLTVQTDQNLREWLEFADSSFPVSVYHDDYSQFVNNAVNCHWHDAFEFSLILSGKVDYYLDETHIRLKAGDCIFINANTMHSSSPCESCREATMLTVLFSSSLLTNSVDSTIYTSFVQPVLNSSLQGLKIEKTTFADVVRDALRQTGDLDPAQWGYELQCLGLISQLWYATLAHIHEQGIDLSNLQSRRRCEQRAKRILSYIHEHYKENITVGDIAKDVGISRSECFRCFRRAANKKPVEYLNHYRLLQAARMLLETDSSITEISTSCGFSNSSYFGKLFRETFGAPPGEFRRKGKINAKE